MLLVVMWQFTYPTWGMYEESCGFKCRLFNKVVGVWLNHTTNGILTEVWTLQMWVSMQMMTLYTSGSSLQWVGKEFQSHINNPSKCAKENKTKCIIISTHQKSKT